MPDVNWTDSLIIRDLQTAIKLLFTVFAENGRHGAIRELELNGGDSIVHATSNLVDWGADSVFVLATGCHDFFQAEGVFEVGAAAILPAER